MKILVDSSVWIDYFNGGNKSEKLDILLDNNLVWTTGIILTEIIPFINPKTDKELIALLLTLPREDKTINWNKIIEYQRLLLKQGINKISIPDLMIADLVLSLEFSLYTLDKHFTLMQKVLPLNLFMN